MGERKRNKKHVGGKQKRKKIRAFALHAFPAFQYSIPTHWANLTLIEPILSYTDTAWGELSVGSSKSLQRLQNRAARIILKRDSSRDTFNVLGWTDLETNRKIHKCVLVFKCLHNLVPQY